MLRYFSFFHGNHFKYLPLGEALQFIASILNTEKTWKDEMSNNTETLKTMNE